MTQILFYLERRVLDAILPGLIEHTLERGWRALRGAGRRKLVLWALLAAGAVVTPASALPSLDPKDGAVFPEAKARDLLHQCSRGVPGPVQGTWTPSAAQIAELEARLPGALDDVLAKRGDSRKRSRDFLRQYGGFIVGGRKIIYMNAFPRFLLRDEKSAYADRHRSVPDWRSVMEGVCDGGPDFFGVEYDPAMKTFSHFEFNGLV